MLNETFNKAADFMRRNKDITRVTVKSVKGNCSEDISFERGHGEGVITNVIGFDTQDDPDDCE